MEPEDTKHDDAPLLFENQVDSQALITVAECTCAHARIGASTIVGVTAPRSHFEQSQQFCIQRQRFVGQLRDLVQRRAICLDRVHLQAQPGLRILPPFGVDIMTCGQRSRMLEHIAMRLLVLRRPRHTLPTTQERQNACQIESFGRVRHRLTKFSIEVTDLLRQQRGADRPWRRFWRRLLSPGFGVGFHAAIVATHAGNKHDLRPGESPIGLLTDI